jgi:hypothetical protein
VAPYILNLALDVDEWWASILGPLTLGERAPVLQGT